MIEPEAHFNFSSNDYGRNTERVVDKDLPEIFANKPLENTTLVFSVPVKGEWENGNLLRFIKAMLSQNPQKGESFEVELLFNIGNDLINTNKYSSLEEADKSIRFVRKIIDIQKEFRDKGSVTEEIFQSTTDPLERDILYLTAKQATTISFVLINATAMDFKRTPYKEKYNQQVSIGALRTLGVDFAKVRFSSNPNIILSLFDADTIPSNNNYVKSIQQIFSQCPELNYLFNPMNSLPPGYSMDFTSGGPNENLMKAREYNCNSKYGSSQISFRLKSYDYLNEISPRPFFGYGYEDYDTGYRLIHCFSQQQPDLSYFYRPIILTMDRLDGHTDSLERNLSSLEIDQKRLNEIFNLKDRIFSQIENEPPEKRQKILTAFAEARKYFKKEQQTQSRFNRAVVNCFLVAVNKGFIKYQDNYLYLDIDNLKSLNFGTVLSYYARYNQDLIKEVMSSPDNLAITKYFLGQEKNPPENLSSFQSAIREYVGDVHSLDELHQQGLIAAKKSKDCPFPNWFIYDLRDSQSKDSLMYAGIIELLAIGSIYQSFYEKKDEYGSDTSVKGVRYGELFKRLEFIKNCLDLNKH